MKLGLLRRVSNSDTVATDKMDASVLVRFYSLLQIADRGLFFSKTLAFEGSMSVGSQRIPCAPLLVLCIATWVFVL